ncbi:MAG: ABC transporter permease [Acidimicrobiales bacterium]
MTAPRPRAPGWKRYAIMGAPLTVLAVFFLVPFAMVVAASFYRNVDGGFYEPAFVLDSWERLAAPYHLDRIVFSVLICLLVAALTTAAAFPFTWFLTRMTPRRQVTLLVVVLASMTLSEAIVGFSWHLLLGRSTGIGRILVWVGLTDTATAYTPGFWAVVIGLSYSVFPYCVLVLFPPLRAIGQQLIEAAGTLGASPFQTFTSVVWPLARPAVTASFLLGFVFTLGINVVVEQLGRPEHWTLAVLISDAASSQANTPLASALAVFVALVSLGVVALVSVVESRLDPSAARRRGG